MTETTPKKRTPLTSRRTTLVLGGAALFLLGGVAGLGAGELTGSGSGAGDASFPQMDGSTDMPQMGDGQGGPGGSQASDGGGTDAPAS